MVVKPRDPLRRAKLRERNGNRCKITFGGGTTITNVPIIGDPSFLHVGDTVTVLCVDDSPVVFSISGWGDLPPLTNGEILIPGATGGISLHPPVTLYGTSINTVFNLILQKLAFKTQLPHTFLAGSATTGNIFPVFRELVLADLPAIELDDLDDVDAASPDDGDVLTYDSASGDWVPEAPTGGTVMRQSILTFVGALTVVANPLKIYNRLGASQDIDELFACVGTAPTGANLIVSVTVNGSSIGTVTITAGSTTGSAAISPAAAWASGSYISAAVTQIGSTVAGSDLVVHVRHS